MNPPDRANRGRVLVVDDDATIRLLAGTTLVQAGYEVIEAADGAVALEILEDSIPDVVLLDIMLPGMDGFQLCSAIRGMPEGKDTPVIVMTGLDDSDSIMTAFRAGATDFITKPVSWQTLAYRVHYIFKAGQAFRALRKNEESISQAQRIARMGSWEWRPAEDRLELSDTCRLLLDLPDAGQGLTLDTFLSMSHPDDREHLARSLGRCGDQQEQLCIDFRILFSDGSEHYMHAEAIPHRPPQGRTTMVTGTLQDITDRKKTEDQIRFLAYYDNLTKLPNRILFNELLNRAIASADRKKSRLAVLFIDLDRFKGVNDSLGHTVGDLLLQEIAERLKDCIRQADALCRKSPPIGESSIARLGGDEFMILINELKAPDFAALVANRIIESFSAPFRPSAYEIYSTCSIGISIYPDDATDHDDLIKHADIAMYAAKELGRNTFQFYKNEMNTATLQRLMLENQLRGAIERNEFVLNFQPQVDSLTGTLVSVEALVRWQKPEFGVVSPATFIPIAEESGLIVDIDEWVLRSVCRQLHAWQQEGIAPVRVAVNLSGRHFQRNSLIPMVSRALADSGAAPHLLELELTEGVLMQQLPEASEALSALRKMGVSISIDDFGTGYSSLSYLKNFPLSTLKIDRAFVKEIGQGNASQAIIKAIIALGKGLGLEVIAEGVETREQLAFLKENDCTTIQGFIYSRPLSLEEVTLLLAGERVINCHG